MSPPPHRPSHSEGGVGITQGRHSHPTQRAQGWQVAVQGTPASQGPVTGPADGTCRLRVRVRVCVGARDVAQRAPAVSGSRREAGVGARETAQGRSARRTHRTLAATEDMASLLSALLREAAAPMVEAAAHPPASERAPRPPPPPGEPRRGQARARDLHGRAGDPARPAAPGAAAGAGGDAPPTAASGAGPGGRPP